MAAELTTHLGGLDLFERLAAIRARIGGPIVFTTSFGLEDQAIAHALFSQKLKIDVATLDTGRLFPETYERGDRAPLRHQDHGVCAGSGGRRSFDRPAGH